MDIWSSFAHNEDCRWLPKNLFQSLSPWVVSVNWSANGERAEGAMF